MTTRRLCTLLQGGTRLSAVLSGASHVLDIGSTSEPILIQISVYNPDADPGVQDFKALQSDWQAVGDALRASMEAVSHGQTVESNEAAESAG